MKQIFYILFLIQIIVSACIRAHKASVLDQNKTMDLEQIKKRGKIIAVTDYNTANYFIYKGTPMGYQYELLEDFADHIGLQLELKVEDNIDDKLEMLNEQKCDIIAVNMTITQDRKKKYAFTDPHAQTRQVLIQRRDDNKNDYYVSDPIELSGKTVYVQENSEYALRLHDMANEMGETIYIREVKEKPETLIKWVSKGKIDYTVTNENIALINNSLYNNIDISLPVSFKQNVGWIVRQNNPELLGFINQWLKEFKKTTKYRILYRSYFVNGNIDNIARSDYSTFGAGKMSVYDHAIKKYSMQIGWDWKLLASLIYQESRFKPDAKSWAGAYGIMQLMPSTAKWFGVDTTSAPEEQIRAGVKFLKWLDKRFEDEIPDKNERIKFILASYNVGYGHIQDARRLAKKHHKNPDIWKDNVEYFILNKSKPEYFNDSVVKYGYCRGTETYNYVKEIIERYRHYTNLYVEN